MIRNYFLVAVRNLARNKFFSAINISGLAISMAVCMAIIMLVADQMQYDRYNPNGDRIFRINSYAVDSKGNDRSSLDNATSPMPLRDELLTRYTGIETVVRIKRGFGNGWLELENQDVNIPLRGFFADKEALTFFGYELEYGDETTALVKPYSVVLTRKASDKLFKDENPIGKTIKVGEVGTYTVTGVLRETKNKSHIVFEALASMSSVESLVRQGQFVGQMDDWLNFWNGWTYIMLEPGTTTQAIQPHLENIYQQHIATVANPEVYKARFRLQNLFDMTPSPLVNNPIGPSLPWIFIYFFSGLAAVIMLTSCFNFTNLSIARSLKRAKEIGVRKVTGAARWQIFTQFLTESVVVAFCALLLAFALTLIFKPVMLQLTFARLLMWDLELNYLVIAIFVVFATVVGIFAGLFPAVVLSSFQPVKVLKSLSNVKLFSRMGLRKSLLVIQFTISLIFILSVIVMYNQLDLFLNKDYGFNLKDNISVRLNNTSAKALKVELLKYSNILNAAGSSHIPSSGTTIGNGFKTSTDQKDWTSLDNFTVDEDYLRNLEVSLVAGKFFGVESGDNNKNFIVINEEAVKTLHFKTPHDAVGEELIAQSDSSRKTIIGVVKNYNHGLLFHEIEPLGLLYDPDGIALLQVRYAGNHQEAVKTIEKAWASVNPNLKIDYKTVEEEIKFFYNTVFGDLVNILGVIAALAIMISCLGLLGMATYTIETRMKEISIRKVLGSTDQALIVLLSKGFIKMIAVAILIGIPTAWFINNLWLELLAYHTQLGIGSITVGVVLLLVLAGITVGSQTLRGALTNPVDNLKNE